MRVCLRVRLTTYPERDITEFFYSTRSCAFISLVRLPVFPQSVCFVFFNCGLFALAATAGAAGFVWWQFDSVVAVALWALSGGIVILAVATW